MSELVVVRDSLLLAFGQLPLVVQVLLWFMLLDYVSGVMAAIVTREVCSTIGVIGLMRKCGQIVLLVSVHLADALLPGTPALDLWFATGFLINEAISILENLDRCEVPLPTKVRGIMKVVKTTEGLRRYHHGK